MPSTRWWERPGPRRQGTRIAFARSAGAWLVVAASWLCLSAAMQAQGDATLGKTRYALCQACHGLNGEGSQPLNAPNLAGQDSAYLERQILNFKTGVRGYDASDIFGAQMKAMANTLPDAKAVQDLLAYVATLPKPKPPTVTVTGDASVGRELFGVCAQCHGTAGEGNAAMSAPRIAGLPDWYVLRQLQNFRAKTRGNHPQDPYGVQMRPMIRAIQADPGDDQPLRDVTAYLATLP